MAVTTFSNGFSLAAAADQVPERQTIGTMVITFTGAGAVTLKDVTQAGAAGTTFLLITATAAGTFVIPFPPWTSHGVRLDAVSGGGIVYVYLTSGTHA